MSCECTSLVNQIDHEETLCAFFHPFLLYIVMVLHNLVLVVVFDFF